MSYRLFHRRQNSSNGAIFKRNQVEVIRLDMKSFLKFVCWIRSKRGELWQINAQKMDFYNNCHFRKEHGSCSGSLFETTDPGICSFYVTKFHNRLFRVRQIPKNRLNASNAAIISGLLKRVFFPPILQHEENSSTNFTLNKLAIRKCKRRTCQSSPMSDHVQSLSAIEWLWFEASEWHTLIQRQTF